MMPHLILIWVTGTHHPLQEWEMLIEVVISFPLKEAGIQNILKKLRGPVLVVLNYKTICPDLALKPVMTLANL